MDRPPQAIRGAKLPLRPMHVWARPVTAGTGGKQTFASRMKRQS